MIIKITWAIDDDGTIGNKAHCFTFDTDDETENDAAWEALSKQKKDAAINQAVQTEFDRSVSWFITDKKLENKS